jgi:methylglutamate dehydrogenase subunit D
VIEALAARTQAHPSDSPSQMTQKDVTLIGCAPGQWLALAKGSRVADFVAELTLALSGIASVTDHTSAKTVVRISSARDALAKGCPVDLRPRAFKPGSAVTTRIAQIGCMLWQVDETPTYDLAVNSSIARSLWTWLANSAAEYGYQVALSSRS